MKRVTSLLIIFLSFSLCLKGQDQYMVFFNDKDNSSFSVDSPLAFLSQRAISRRLKNNVFITAEDFPVNQSYVDQVAVLGIETYFSSRWMNALLVQMEDEDTINVLSLPFVDRIEYVSPSATLTSQPGEAAQAALSPIEPSRIEQSQYIMLGIDRMHQEGFRGDGLLVAIFDSGFRNYTNLPAFSHLIDREGIIQTFDYTKNSVSVENNFDHGLRVLSVLGADAEMIGAVPQANYILAITENEVSEYRIEEYNWLFAAEMADSAGVDVINTSLGYSVFDDESMSYTQDQMDGETTVISRAASIAASKGIVLVASAGNEGNNAWGTITAPADSEHLLAVGAVNNLADLANFSSTGPSADGRIKPDVVAQGVNTQLTNSQGTVTFQNGTSFSAPLVAGLAAGLMEAFPEKTSLEIMNIIRQAGDRAANPDSEYGFGIPFFERAAQIADETLIPFTDEIVAYPNPTSLSYFMLSFGEELFGEQVTLQLFDSNGGHIEAYTLTPSLFNNKQRIDLSGARTGVLLLKLITHNGTVIKKIIKAG